MQASSLQHPKFHEFRFCVGQTVIDEKKGFTVSRNFVGESFEENVSAEKQQNDKRGKAYPAITFVSNTLKKVGAVQSK